MEFKSGFIALTGSPNVGKSTLLNALVGTKIAIVSKKPQTTRSRITGVLTREEYQMVFMDTPGLQTPKNKLGEFMLKTAEQTARDVDAVLFVADAKVGVREKDEEILKRLGTGETPLVIALNKIDAVDGERVREQEEILGKYGRKVFRISAAEKLGLAELVEYLKQYLVEGPMYYPAEMVTDQPEQVIAAELIREKALKSIGKEIPHGIGVVVEKLEREEDRELTNIDAVIYCEKDSHKGIIIGAGGRMLKKIASAAREDMQMLFGGKVFLQVWVKVKPDWRNKSGMLRTLGYDERQ
ncbi:GTPase Era [Christensenella tenuis]|jgi:GTPase|uniref:GTPase Era n=1 Tax=Christensenella tenuis TaxID=2763033 RepID=A0ABR7EC38_9FIRM|nr:GTPase Era [Christensenella tenuis]MBC5647337.1 GTPase Era [Christensenella tenuis]